MRAVALSLLLILGSIATVSAQSTPPPPTISVSPDVASPTVSRDVHLTNLSAGERVLLVIFDPDGEQSVYTPQADSQGTVDLSISPPYGAWKEGVYRVVLSLPSGRAISATFAANDGEPHLYAGPGSPSPTSALVFSGTGFPAGVPVTVHLSPTGGHLAAIDLQVTPDANGTFVTYLWPDQLGVPFFPAGPYMAAVPAYGLDASFTVREHPASARVTLTSPDPVQPGQTAALRFQDYGQDRYLWGVVTGPGGTDEFLVGPTDIQGALAAQVTVPDLGAGRYYLATPYDWGEASFDAVEPTPTATATATSTPRPTARPKPTPKPTAKPTRTHNKKKCVTKHAKKGAKGKTKSCRKHR